MSRHRGEYTLADSSSTPYADFVWPPALACCECDLGSRPLPSETSEIKNKTSQSLICLFNTWWVRGKGKLRPPELGLFASAGIVPLRFAPFFPERPKMCREARWIECEVVVP